MNQDSKNRLYVSGWIILAILVLYGVLTSCASFKRTAWVAAGSAGGAAAGSLAGPAGTIGGAALGGGLTSAVVDSDQSQERADRMEDRLYGAPPPSAPEPYDNPFVPNMPLWGWLAALWAWLRRAHIVSAMTGSEPRGDALLRALGLRTHKTPIPKTDAQKSRARL